MEAGSGGAILLNWLPGFGLSLVIKYSSQQFNSLFEVFHQLLLLLTYCNRVNHTWRRRK